MITLACTKCADRLTVDDGFAGGVCRCCRCGTIQTVPAADAAAAAAARSIWERDRPSARQPTSVDESSDDLTVDDRPARARRATTPSAAAHGVARQWPAVVAVVVAGLLAVGVAAALCVTLDRSRNAIGVDAGTRVGMGGESSSNDGRAHATPR